MGMKPHKLKWTPVKLTAIWTLTEINEFLHWFKYQMNWTATSGYGLAVD